MLNTPQARCSSLVQFGNRSCTQQGWLLGAVPGTSALAGLKETRSVWSLIQARARD